MLDRMESLEVFARVVELGGFAPAARALRRSPAQVAKHVDTLEAALGARLLNRTTRRVTTTEVGANYYERAREIIAQFEQANREVAARQSAPGGVLRVTLPVAFETVLDPVVARFGRLHPEVSLDIIADDRRIDLADQRIDLAIRAGRLPDSSLIARKLAAYAVVVCASPDYLERRGAPESLDALRRHDVIAYSDRWSGDAWVFVDPETDAETSLRFPRIRHRANSAGGQRALALQGLGIARLPEPFVRDDVTAGRLRLLVREAADAKRWLHALYLPTRTLPLATRGLIQHLESEVRAL